jgi:multidrug resistance protein
MSIFPLWWASFSEEFGRRTIYIACFSLFVVFSVLSAISTNISMLIVMRLLGGGCSASVHAVGAGTIADTWEVRERGRAMSMFYLGPLLGPLISPIIGGVLAEKFGWRSTMWFISAYGFFVLVLLFLLLPETLARKKADEPTIPTPARNITDSDGNPIPLNRRHPSTMAVSIHTKRLAIILKRFLLDPLSVLLMLRFPAVTLTALYAAITFGALFVLNISIQDAFTSSPYSFDVLIVGLLYLPPSLGYLMASLFGGRWIDRIMAREAEKAGRYDEKGRPIYLPEDRFKENAWIASTIYPCAMVLYGWTVTKGVHWIVPSVGNFVFGVGSMLVFVSCFPAFLSASSLYCFPLFLFPSRTRPSDDKSDGTVHSQRHCNADLLRSHS